MELDPSHYNTVPYSAKLIDDSVIVHDHLTGNVHELNETAFSALELCRQMFAAGRVVSVEAVAEYLVREFAVGAMPLDVVASDIRDVLQAFLDEGLIVLEKQG